MTQSPMPTLKPKRPYFSSGPCVKHPGWSSKNSEGALLGRSHRGSEALEQLKRVIDKTRSVLEIPKDYHIAILPGSATGAAESALWNLIGARPVTILTHDVFSYRWECDVIKSLKVSDAVVRSVKHGYLPNTKDIPLDHDVILNWNGSTSGVCYPNTDFLLQERQDNADHGLVIADVTSAAFAMDIPWKDFDATVFSWQKGLGGEAGHGMLVLSPKAVKRLESYLPTWPIPYLFKLRKGCRLYAPIFEEKTLNTPSMMCVQDFEKALDWSLSLVLKNKTAKQALIEKSQKNFEVVEKWVSKTPWIHFFVSEPSQRSTSTIVLKITHRQFEKLEEDKQYAFLKRMGVRLLKEGAAFEIINHPSAPPSIRIWGGPTVDVSDLEALFPWLDWAFERTIASL